MVTYKHTQISYLTLTVTLATLIFFVWSYITAVVEPPSYYSGTNFLIAAIMILILFIPASFTTLTTSIDENYFQIKFGYGIFTKAFPLNQIASARSVKNRWYYGWETRVWFWPYMWIYNVSCFDAVEIVMGNGKIYRIGTGATNELEVAIKQAINTKLE